MSKSFTIANLNTIDVVTGANSLGLLYLYYSISELGSDMNKKIGTLAKVLKKVNRNNNVVDMHLKRHLVSHKTDLDLKNNDFNYEYVLKLEERIKRLEDVILENETVLNPIVGDKILKFKKDLHENQNTITGIDTQPLW